MMDLAGFTRLDDQRTSRARARANEMMVHRRRRQEAGDRRVVFASTPFVRQDDQRVASPRQRCSRPHTGRPWPDASPVAAFRW